MRKSIVLKMCDGASDATNSLKIDVELDREHQVVTLHMLDFDSALVAEFVARALPYDFNVRVDDSLFEHVLSLPRYVLVIDLAGRHHPAHIHHHQTGEVSIRLGDPDAAYLARCRSAIEKLLSALHELGVEGVVAGIDRHGRPELSEGFLHLFVRAEDEPKEDDIHQLCRDVEREHSVDICVMRFSTIRGNAEAFIEHQPHFAFDADEHRVVRRSRFDAPGGDGGE